MTTFIHLKRFQFYLYVGAVWLLLWIVNSLLSYPHTFVQHSLNEIWRFIYIVVANFIFFEYALPLIIRKRSIILINILIGILLIFLLLVSVSVGLYGWKFLGIQLHIYTPLRHVTLQPDGIYYQIIEDIFYQAQGGITSIFFFGIAKLLYANYKLTQTTQQLRLEKQEAELNYLKSQTNPHFLFNTLNNIYSLARDKSDLAPESILQLSKILRFMLYETNDKFIDIEQEQKIISDYIALEKLRYDNSLHINFEYEIEDPKQPLPPLLLIPLVENAFKHGVSETSQNAFVNIHLSTTRKRLLFVVNNSSENVQSESDLKENIGLTNLRRQLKLLYSDHDLVVQQKENEFIVTLKINLDSYV